MYEDAFEAKFLKATEALYHEEGNRYMQETDVSFEYCHVKHRDTPQLSVINWLLILESEGCISSDFIEVQRKKKKVIVWCTRPSQNVKLLDIFTL